jgi:hypothetical protein
MADNNQAARELETSENEEDDEIGTGSEQEDAEGTNESESGGDDDDDGDEEEEYDEDNVDEEDDYDDDDVANGEANTEDEDDDNEDSVSDPQSERQRVGKRDVLRICVLMFTIFFVGLAVGVAYLGGKNHEALHGLSIRFPILKSIGEFFHVTKTNESSGKTLLDPKLHANWDWNDQPLAGATLFTDSEIAFSEGKKPLLVILGNVFDVSGNYESYKAGSGYHGFIGQDGSRAFVSGDFTEAGLISDLDGLKLDDYIGLVKWLGFYFKTYPHMGYLIGRFYDKNGKETAYFQKLRQWVKDAENAQAADGDVKKQFPPCNMEWSAKTETTEYWCSKKSGGIDRDWEGYPYQFKESEEKSYRCACINPNHLKDPRVKPYDNCPPKSSRCKMHSPKN